MPARSSSPILAVLTELGPLDERGIGRLRAHLERVPDPRSRRGRWYPLSACWLICSCAVVSGARTIEEIAEWGQRAAVGLLARMGVRRHLPGRYRAPSHPTLTRILAAVDGDALDTAVGADLAEHDRGDVQAAAAPGRAIAVDGKALAGSAHLVQRHRHLLSAVSHAPATITLAQREVGAKTNETAAFRPLLESLDLAGAVITFDAMHSVKDQVRWLVQDKDAHYLVVIKGNQPTAFAQLTNPPWDEVPIAHTASQSGHGRRESRSLKTLTLAASTGGLAFPYGRQALRVHRRRQETGRKQPRETVYAVTSLDVHQATPADLAGYVRGH